MAIHQFETGPALPVDLDEAWAFISDPRNPAWMAGRRGRRAFECRAQVADELVEGEAAPAASTGPVVERSLETAPTVVRETKRCAR